MEFVENNRFVDFSNLTSSRQSGLQDEHTQDQVGPVLAVDKGACRPQDSQFIATSLGYSMVFRSSYPQSFTDFAPQIENKSFSLIHGSSKIGGGT